MNLAHVPTTDLESWLESAEQSVELLKCICERNEETILYASGPHFHVHSALAPRAAVNPPDHNDLGSTDLIPSDTWCITQKASGDDEGHRVYLEPPLSCSGSQTLAGGEKLIFLRSFEGVEEYQSIIEISQKLVHVLDLYYMDERHAYCRLDNHGNIEDVITVLDDKHSDPWQCACMVTIRGHELARYMALSNTSLVIKFEFTRFVPKAFSSWDGQNPQTYQYRDLYYRSCVIPNHASYANGHIVLHTDLTENNLIKRSENTNTKQYASFKIFDWKNNRLVETSCGPDGIVNYFTASDKPFEMSPAFFQPEVLQKYKSDREKYTIRDRSISCRGTWYLKPYDINEAGQVHTYIGYLATLPHEEQRYWRSFNEYPKGSISKRAYQTDFLGKFSTEDDPLAKLKGQVASLDSDTPAWWKPRGKALIEKVLCPATDSIEEWGNAILAFDHLVVEGFCTKELRPVTSAKGGTYKSWQSLKLLEVALSCTRHTEEQAKKLVCPLKELHDLRNSVAHSDTKKKREAVKNARKTHGTLRKHFQDLTRRVQNSINEIIDTLP